MQHRLDHRKINHLNGGGAYSVGTAIRRNKLAAGMTKTIERSKARKIKLVEPQGAALSLMVKGTTDSLGFGLTFKVTRKACSCCGGKQAGKLVLNESGRRRLRHLRADRARKEKAHG